MKTTRLTLSGISLAVLFSAATILPACKSLTKTQKGAGIGAAAGGTLGAIIGKKAGNTAVGAIIGGAIGGTAGAYIGRNMDKQAAEIEQSVPGAEVIREGEGIIVKFDSGILFDFNKDALKPEAKKNINNLAASLTKYPDTDVMVIGHTDNVGADSYNYGLSERRAASVKTYAATQGVPSSRLKVVGKGETEPIAGNDSETDRALNRRVEIVIVANNKQKQEAKRATN